MSIFVPKLSITYNNKIISSVISKCIILWFLKNHANFEITECAKVNLERRIFFTNLLLSTDIQLKFQWKKWNYDWCQLVFESFEEITNLYLIMILYWTSAHMTSNWLITWIKSKSHILIISWNDFIFERRLILHKGFSPQKNLLPSCS